MLYYSEAFDQTFDNPVVGDTYTAEFDIPYSSYTEYEIYVVVMAFGTSGNWAMNTNKWIVRTNELYPDSLYLSGTTTPYDDWSAHTNGVEIARINPAIVKPSMDDYTNSVFHASVPVKITSATTKVVYASVYVKYVMNKYQQPHS